MEESARCRGGLGEASLPPPRNISYTNSEQNLFFWMDSRRAAHFFLFPLYLSLSPRFQPVMGGRKRKRKDKE
jgi:hypothetical protein